MAVKKTKGKRRKSRGSSRLVAWYIVISIILILLIFSVFFIVVRFPELLSDRLKNYVVSQFDIVSKNDDGAVIVLKLNSEPDGEFYRKLSGGVKHKFGIDIRVADVKNTDSRDIKKIRFYSNGKIFDGIEDLYIYWDKERIPADNTAVKPTDDNTSEVNNFKKGNGDDGAILHSKPDNTNQDVSDPAAKKGGDKRSVEDKISNDQYIDKEEKRRTIKKDKKIVPQKIKPAVVNRVIPKNRSKVAVVIDDVGYSYNSTYEFLKSGVPVTFALIPGVSHSDYFYRKIRENGYCLILHIPMEPLKGAAFVEKNAILTGMNSSEITHKIKDFFTEYPAAVGANNHMGSRAVGDRDVMSAIFSEMSKMDKIWVNSMTTSTGLSASLAGKYGITYYERSVFLDNEKSYLSIKKSMDKLVGLSKKQGYAVGIGHIQSENLNRVLREYYDRRSDLGIEFVSVEDIGK